MSSIAAAAFNFILQNCLALGPERPAELFALEAYARTVVCSYP